MGTYSFYLTTRNNAKDCKIDWNSINTDVLFRFSKLKHAYKIANTLQELAEMLHESKLFGYLTEDMKQALLELNYHLVPYGTYPRIYFDYEGSDVIHALEFIPGQNHMNIIGLNCDKKARENRESIPELPGWYSETLYN